MTCECISGNCPELGGSVKGLVVKVPDELFASREDRLISVDPCIASALALLWSTGISTMSNCCGHNGQFPRHFVIGKADYSTARRILDAHGWGDVCLSYWDGDVRVDDIKFERSAKLPDPFVRATPPGRMGQSAPRSPDRQLPLRPAGTV